MKTNITKKNIIFFCIIIFVIGILSRLPYLTKYLYYWDSVNFALGLDRYNVAEFRPSPPGNFVYIFLAKPLYFLFHDANKALVYISMLATSVGAVILFLFSLQLFPLYASIAAVALFLSSPVIWFHGITAFTYMLDGCFIMFFVYFCLLLVKMRITKTQCSNAKIYAIFAGLFLGLAAGVRQQDLVLLFPLYLYTLYKQKPIVILYSFATLVITVLAWVTPMLCLSGGLDSYLKACKLQSEYGIHNSIMGYLKYWAYIAQKILKILSKTLTLSLAPLLLCIFFERKNIFKNLYTPFFIFWFVPCLLFWFGFHLSNVGHSFTCLWGIFPLVGYAIYRLSSLRGASSATSGETGDAAISKTTVFETLLFLCILVNIFVFFYDAHPNKEFKCKTWYKEQDIRKRDYLIGEKTNFIKENFNPKDTIILGDTGGSGNMPQIGYYLPEFNCYHLNTLEDKTNSTILFTKNREYPKAINSSGIFSIPQNIKNIVLVDPIYPDYLKNKNMLNFKKLNHNVSIAWITLSGQTKIIFNYKNWEIS